MAILCHQTLSLASPKQQRRSTSIRTVLLCCCGNYFACSGSSSFVQFSEGLEKIQPADFRKKHQQTVSPPSQVGSLYKSSPPPRNIQGGPPTPPSSGGFPDPRLGCHQLNCQWLKRLGPFMVEGLMKNHWETP